MATMSILPLDEAIDTLIHLTRDVSSLSPKASGKLYLASLAFLCHLNVDQETIHKKLELHGDQAKAPLPSQTPAIAAVLHNETFFRAILRCLTTTTPVSVSLAGDPDSNEFKAGRKRSLPGLVDNSSDKAMKLTHSPVPPSGTARAGTKMTSNNDSSGGQQQYPRPSLNVSILAATILYGALQHIDHWPAPLMKVYADDCFGARKWVDLKECELLVKNLALAHAPENEGNNNNEVGESVALMVAADADTVAATYRDFVVEEGESIPTIKRSTSVESSQGRRNSLSSTGSHSIGHHPTGISVPDDSIDMEEEKDESDGGESSSGDEDDEVEELLVTMNGNSPNVLASSPRNEHAVEERKLYPVNQRLINVDEIRQRYFGSNRHSAHEMIVKSLSGRLDVKSKQNSGLLFTLPSFMAVPEVRQVATENLERWLQSPALAGLARTLFSSIVKSMKNVDPPLEADLIVIDSIITMQLKHNQLNTHIENIVEMARGIPNASVINRMYSKLLCSVIESSEAAKSTSTDKMKMIVAIHKTIPSDISYDGLAAALLSMLAKKRLLVEEISDELSSAKPDQASLVKRLRAVIRSLAGEIAFSFDGCALLNALLSLDVNDGIWSTSDEENKARLMFECVLMHAASNGTGSVERQVDLEQALANAKKMLLKWCCTDYGPRFNGRVRRKRKLLDVGNAENGIRIPAPDFQSVLGPSSDERIPTWLNTMRCLLFIEDAGSTLMKHFIAPGAVDDVEWKDEESRIRICCDLSKTLDDEMIWIVLRSCAQAKGGLTSEIAIQLLENLFENCGKGHIHELKVSDPMLVWELYNLVLFDPSGSNATTMLVDSSSRTDTDEAPRLALSHLWWRVTTLALIMCAASTQDIGEVIWSEHPTLQSMIKMVTSNRYRFPTVDCDDRARNEAKVAEQNARDLEALVAERLFLPPKKEIKVSAEKKGSRTSTRLLKKESEAKAAREMAEKKQRKSLLRAAQKSIMIWDPDAPARKPPKEAADLLLSVEHIFKLSEIFQRSVTPDFLLLTLGGTDRGAVERAHEWLIPVISKVPSTISRLPSSASCFLLLRAYGTDGGERAQLKELALPLLGHVSACLLGNLGSSEAVKALDLLLSDMASSKPERRRCSRRVLQDSLASLDTGGNKESWFLKILSLEHAEVVVQNAIRFMASAASFERGKILATLILALDHFVVFAREKSLDPGISTSELTLKLISTRPGVFVEAIDLFPDLRAWILKVVTEEFVQEAHGYGRKANSDDSEPCVQMKLSSNSSPIKISLKLLEAACVLLSVWKDEYTEAREGIRTAIDDLVDDLLKGDPSNEETGLASATMISEGGLVPIESWIMLAKARSDVIARRAALSAPTSFLPRLLLCSGLPKASLVTMIDRLGALGDTSVDKEGDYTKLLEPSTSSEWDIGRLGKNHDLTLKLQSRLAAYVRLYSLTADTGEDDRCFSLTFINWLSAECRANAAKRKICDKQKKEIRIESNTSIVAAAMASSILSNLVIPDETQIDLSSTKTAMTAFQSGLEDSPTKDTVLLSSDASLPCYSKIAELIRCGNHQEADSMLYQSYVSVEKPSVASLVLDFVRSSWQGCKTETNLALKWIPLLSCNSPLEELWKELFLASEDCERNKFLDLLVEKCSLHWDEEHIRACIDWIVVPASISSHYCLKRMSVFVLSCSGLKDATLSHASIGTRPVRWTEDGDRCDSLLKLCLESALQSDFEQLGASSSMTLLLVLVASISLAKARRCVDVILQRITGATDDSRQKLQCILLHLYFSRPETVDLTVPVVQSALLLAGQAIPEFVKRDFSTIDELLDNTFRAWGSASDCARVGRGVTDIARSHPLVLLRKVPDLTVILRADAGAHQITSELRINGEMLLGRKEASLGGRDVLVNIRHWGLAYTEALWLSVLDVLLSVPEEILFSCGAGLGLKGLLNLYLQLLDAQTQLRNPENSTRLKHKLAELLVKFESTSPRHWMEWTGSVLEESQVSDILDTLGFATSASYQEHTEPELS